ncbi:metallophosphoesterase, partial [Archaeoglobales archaeon]
MVKFIHMADVHLGFKQYGSEARLLDFAQAFKNAVRYGIDEDVDFVIIAGDLFHKKSDVDPFTLTQATKVLEMAKKAEIPVIAVEGNHDSTYFKDHYSWMDYLAMNDYLINLKPSFEEGMKLKEWDGQSGAYVDIDGVRIYGMKYYGSLTERILDEYVKKIKKKGFTVFVAHVGIEGYMNIYGCVSATKLHKFKNKVDYIALGHIHKSFVEDFIFNPGSLETCDISEYSFKRGAFLVEFDGKIRYNLVEFPRRKFVILEHNFEDYDSFKEFLSNQNKKETKDSVLHLKLNAKRNVKKLVDDIKLQKIVYEILNPLIVRLNWNIVDGIFEPILDLGVRKSLENQVIEQLLESYPYGKIADEVLRLKSIFSSSFDIKRVDGFVESILNLNQSQGVEEKEE